LRVKAEYGEKLYRGSVAADIYAAILVVADAAVVAFDI
jgi:hypothetical protein